MTISFTFLNDATKQPAVYYDRPDLDRFTLQIASDRATPADVQSLRVKFPVRIFAVDLVAKIAVTTPGWTAKAAGPYLTLTPSGSVGLSSSAPLTVGLSGVTSNLNGAANDDLQVFAGDEAPTAKIFAMRYPAEAADLSEVLEPKILPERIYRTPADYDKIANVLTLRLINLDPDAPLVAMAWAERPTVRLSFVYGDDIGSLTKADPTISDKHSAFNIAIEPTATYKDGERTYEWDATPPDPGATDTSPVWALRPVAENPSVLGAGSGATAEFRISGISTAAPAGSTLIYLQFSDFPGYNDGFMALPLSKDEPEPAIVYFDGVPNHVEKLGDTVRLEWQTVAMARVELQAHGRTLDGPFDPARGSHPVTIDRTTDFALLAYTKADDTEPAHDAQWTGHVPDAEIVDFSADHSTVADGSPVVLHWSTRFARAAEIRSDATRASGPKFTIPSAGLAGGSKTYFPRQPTTYTLHVTGQGDPPDRSVEVFVLQRGWSSRRMAFSPYAGEGPVLYGTDAGLVLVGGQSDNAVFTSPDGAQWVQAGVAEFPARDYAAGCSFAGRLWILGGLHGRGPVKDVWRSDDGLSWTRVTGAAPWAARSRFACAAFKDKLWIFGGQDQNLQPLGDVWCSPNGADWTAVKASGPRWSARSGPAVAQHQGKLWLFGGLQAGGTVAGDLWVSEDGAAWTALGPDDLFGGVTARQQAALGSLGGSLCLFGGVDAQGAPLSDFNTFGNDGWDLATGPSGWATSQAGFTIWRGAFWFAGGLDGGAASDRVWSWFPG